MKDFEVRNLCLDVGGFALDNINLALDKNCHYVILGASGSGKTLFLESIAGRYRLDSGEILKSDNGEVKELQLLPPEKREIGFVYQNYELFPHLNVFENITLPLKIKKYKIDDIKSKTYGIMEELDIMDIMDRDVSSLSGGEKQRSSIARALVTEPKILLLDEPMSALDYVTKQKTKDIIKSVCQKHCQTVIHVTHDISEALFFANRIGIMKQGKIVKEFEINEELLAQKEDLFYDYL